MKAITVNPKNPEVVMFLGIFSHFYVSLKVDELVMADWVLLIVRTEMGDDCCTDFDLRATILFAPLTDFCLVKVRANIYIFYIYR